MQLGRTTMILRSLRRAEGGGAAADLVSWHHLRMVAWVKRAVLCALIAGCGGHAERHVDSKGTEANGGAGGDVAGAPGSGGAIPDGMGGNGAVGGAVGAGVGGGVVIDPTTGGDGNAGASWDGFTGPPSGTPVGTQTCDRGITTHYAGAIPDVEAGFHGVLDGIPIALASGAPAPGVMSAGSPGCRALMLELLFDGKFEGDQLTLYFNSDDTCITQGWYVPHGADAEPIEGDIALHVWPDGDDDPFSGMHFLYGALSLRAKGEGGGYTHVIEGEFNVYVTESTCFG
jgi:hypothetical protein